MDFIEDLGVGKERAEAGLCAKIYRPAAVLSAREIRPISVVEDPATESDKAWMLLLFRRI